MNLYIPEKYKNNEVSKVELTKEDLINFESRIKEEYEKGTISGPVHMSKGNEDQLLEIFKYVHPVIPIALGAAKAQKLNNTGRKVWCFIGDMTYETGAFHEAYKYSRSHELPLEFVIEDNNMSTNTPTDETWNGHKSKIPKDVFYYFYEREYPHHGTGQWVLF